MPTRLIPVEFTAPGRNGLNTQDSSIGQNAGWALELENATFDNVGRIAARKGFEKITDTPVDAKPTMPSLFEYEKDNNTQHIISTSGFGKIYSGTDTFTDRTGSLTPSNNNWSWANFNSKVVGWQTGETPIYWDGNLSAFTTIQSQIDDWEASTAYVLGDAVKKVSSVDVDWYFVCTVAGTSGGSEPSWNVTDSATTTDNTVTWTAVKIPNGNICLSAYGRLWVVDEDKQTLKYSAIDKEWLFDATNGGGTVDLSSTWSFGRDEVTALAVFNNFLLVFGRNNIIVYSNPITPASLSLADTIVGMGCIARDSIQNIGTDVLFLSPSGLRSFSRTIELQKMPNQDLSQVIRDDLVDVISTTTDTNIKSVFSTEEGFYLLKLGSLVYNFDLKNILRGESTDSVPLPRISRWLGIEPDAFAYAKDGTLYMSKKGMVGKYNGYTDFDYRGQVAKWNENEWGMGSWSGQITGGLFPYTMSYRSNWLDLSEIDPQLANLIKIPKKIKATVRDGESYRLKFVWGYDFTTSSFSYTTSSSAVSGAEWGTSEYNSASWSGSGTLVDELSANMTGSGGHVQIGFDVDINGNNIAIQTIDLLIKVGRVTR